MCMYVYVYINKYLNAFMPRSKPTQVLFILNISQRFYQIDLVDAML